MPWKLLSTLHGFPMPDFPRTGDIPRPAPPATERAVGELPAAAPIPWHFRQLASTDSTNTLAVQTARQYFQTKAHEQRTPAIAYSPAQNATDHAPKIADPHGLIILAQTQTAGRGQYGRSFASPPGGLYASAIITDLAPVARVMLSLAAGFAVALTLEELGVPHVALRWPNDVLGAGKKVAGILCEAVSQGALWAAIVGIGVNVNTATAALPPELSATATSVKALTGNTVEILSLALAIFQRLEQVLRALTNAGGAWLIDQLIRFDALSGRNLTLQVEQQTICGIGAGISQTGCLKLYTNGAVRQFETATILTVDGAPIRQAIPQRD